MSLEIARTCNVRMSRKIFTWEVAGCFCAAVREIGNVLELPDFFGEMGIIVEVRIVGVGYESGETVIWTSLVLLGNNVVTSIPTKADGSVLVDIVCPRSKNGKNVLGIISREVMESDLGAETYIVVRELTGE